MSLLLTFPHDLSGNDATAALVAASAQTSRARPLVLELHVQAGHIEHQLHGTPGVLSSASAALRTSLPAARLDTAPATRPAVQRGRELLTSSGIAPLREGEHSSSPSALFAVLASLRSGETAIVQWIIAATGTPRLPEARRASSQKRGALDVLLAPPELSADARRDYKTKLATPLVQAVGRIAVTAADPTRERVLLAQLLKALNRSARSGVRLRRRITPSGIAATRTQSQTLPWLIWPMTLNAAELVPLLGWPIGVGPVAGLSRGAARLLPVSEAIPHKGSVLGSANYPGQSRDIAISRTDRLQHLHVIGPTGSGKSVLLLNLILGDAERGDGLLVIDPKGDLVSDVLARLPRKRHGDVIVIEPTGGEHVAGLNLLQTASGQRDLAVEQTLSVFRQLFASSWGPRTDDILRAGLTTLTQANRHYTLCELEPLLTVPAFRARLQGTIGGDSQLLSFWSWYEDLSAAERSTVIAPLLNKLRAFTMRPGLRAMLGQSTGVDLGSVFRHQAIVLVNLNKGLLGGEVAGLLGALIVSQFWAAALRQTAVDPTRRRYAWAYLDEFQDVLRLPTSTGDLLAQARGLHLGLTLAHQNLGQLPTAMRSEVLANARNRASFKLGHDDARVLAREFDPHLAEADLRGLRAFEIYAGLQAGGSAQPPCSAITHPAPPAITGQAQTLRTASLTRHGTPRAEVEAQLRERIGLSDASARTPGRADDAGSGAVLGRVTGDPR